MDHDLHALKTKYKKLHLQGSNITKVIPTLNLLRKVMVRNFTNSMTCIALRKPVIITVKWKK